MDRKTKDIGSMLEDDTLIDAVLKKAVREALRRHKQMGNPVVVWRNGKTVWIPSEEIEADAPAPLKSRAPIKKRRRG